jgi:hypothetical protein
MVLDIIVAFVIPLVALLMSSPVMWPEQHLWNFGVSRKYIFPVLLPCW